MQSNRAAGDSTLAPRPTWSEWFFEVPDILAGSINRLASGASLHEGHRVQHRDSGAPSGGPGITALAVQAGSRGAPPPAKDAPRAGFAYMTAASTGFAVAYALTTSLGRAGVPWAVIGLVRAIVGLVASLGLARARGASLRVFGRWAMWTRSLAGSAQSLCIFYAVTHMPLSDAMALIQATPLWIAAGARLTLREPPGRAVTLALALGAVGVI